MTGSSTAHRHSTTRFRTRWLALLAALVLAVGCSVEGLPPTAVYATPASYTLAQLRNGAVAGVNGKTRVAIWLGISGSGSATVSAVTRN
jgi:hypothetical protein